MDGHAVDQHHTAKVEVVNMVDVMVAIVNHHNLLLDMVVMFVDHIQVMVVEVIRVMELHNIVDTVEMEEVVKDIITVCKEVEETIVMHLVVVLETKVDLVEVEVET